MRIQPSLPVSLTSIAALSLALTGCPDDTPPETGTTTSDDSTTTMTPTTMSTTVQPETTTGDTTTTGVDGTTVVDEGTTTLGETTAETTGDTTGDTTGATTGDTSGESSGSTTGEPVSCGNGVIDAGEDCDGADVGGVTCLDQGFDDGVVACDPVACTLDTSGCFFVESLQNDNGTCANEIGCSDPMGTAGNPQAMVECYQSTLVPPIDVTQVQYSIGVSVPLPTSANLVIYDWAGPGNAPGALVDTVPLDPMVDIVAGAYDFVLPTPVNVATAGFCVGLSGDDAADGFRVTFADGASMGESYIQASACGLGMFGELDTLMFPGNFCIRPTVTSPNQ